MSSATVTVMAMFTVALSAAGLEQAYSKICRVQCQRQSKTVSYGFDNAMEALSVDVGVCAPVYAEDLDGCTIPSDLGEGCYRQCTTRAYVLQTRSNRNGPFSVKTIKSCSATRHHCLESCERKPNFLYVFPDSKYQTRLNVGKCVGSCNDSAAMDCYAIRNRSIAVEGPNGHITVEIIEECGCGRTACYRADYFESYSEQVTSELNNTTSMKRVERVINVGKCIGSCEGVIIPGFCAPSPEDCRFQFGSHPAVCVPTSFSKHTFTDLSGAMRSVAAIDECGCSSG